MINVSSYAAILLLILIFMAVNVVFAFVSARRENIYSYKIMYYIGALVYIGFNILLTVRIIIFDRIHDFSIEDFLIFIFNSSIYFVYALFPMVIIFSVVLAVSNVVLIIREGGGIRNLLGIGLAGFLLFATVIIVVISTFIPTDPEIKFFADTILFALLAYFECTLFGTFIGTVITQRRVPPFDRDYIIILGCSVRADGTPTPLLRGRIDKAVWFANEQMKRTGKDVMYVCSGGQGSDEVISEAESMSNYLISRGIKEEKIIVENNSTSTYENMKYSMSKIEEYKKFNSIDSIDKLAFSTTDYHVFRSGNIAYSQGIKALGMGSRTKWYFYINALIREFVASFKSQWIRHIINIVLIVAVLVLFYIVNYMVYSM